MVATSAPLDPHVTDVVMFAVAPSVYVPVAVNCCVPPAATVGVAGLMLIDVTVACVTSSDAVPLTEPFFAVMVVVPTAALLTRPVELIVATVALEEDQVVRGEDERSWLELSVNVPVAVYCCSRPRAMDGVAGVTAIEAKAAGLTVSKVEAEVEPTVAVIAVLPVFPVAGLVVKPWLPAASLTVTRLKSEEVQWVVLVRSCVDWSV